MSRAQEELSDLEAQAKAGDRVEYEDRLYSLSSFAGNFMPEERQNKSGSYQGPLYFGAFKNLRGSHSHLSQKSLYT